MFFCLHRSLFEKCFDWSIPIKVRQSFYKIMMGVYFVKVRQKCLTIKIVDAGLHAQRTYQRKLLPRF